MHAYVLYLRHHRKGYTRMCDQLNNSTTQSNIENQYRVVQKQKNEGKYSSHAVFRLKDTLIQVPVFLKNETNNVFEFSSLQFAIICNMQFRRITFIGIYTLFKEYGEPKQRYHVE